MAVADENVLVFPRSLFEQLGVFQGFSSDVDRYLPAILDPKNKNNDFLSRAEAETNPDFKQIIPYVVITDGKSILHYVRSEEHTSELQSLRHLVCRLLLEKKK